MAAVGIDVNGLITDDIEMKFCARESRGLVFMHPSLLLCCSVGSLNGEEVAVKTCTSDAVHQDQFLKEVRFMTTLDHRHVLKLFGVCTKPGSDMFIITELLEQGDLRRFLFNDAGDTIGIAQLMSFAEQVYLLTELQYDTIR